MAVEAGERRADRWGSECDGDGGKAMYLPVPEEDIIDQSLSPWDGSSERESMWLVCWEREREREFCVSEWGFW